MVEELNICIGLGSGGMAWYVQTHLCYNGIGIYVRDPPLGYWGGGGGRRLDFFLLEKMGEINKWPQGTVEIQAILS